MPTLGIRQSTWQGLRENQRQIMRWAFQRLALGEPGLYEAPGGVLWFVFDHHRLDLAMFARLGTLANVLAGLPVGWRPPVNPDGSVDRAAVQTEAIERVQATVVCPSDIDYQGQPNPWQHTLNENSAPAAMQGGPAIPVGWVSVDP